MSSMVTTRRLIILLAVVAGLLSSFVGVGGATPLPPGGTFVDDDGSVHEGYIEALSADGIARGCNPPVNDRYCAGQSITRGEMAALLVRSLHLSEGAGADMFSDDDGSVFERDIDRIAFAGITKGCNPPANNHFCPHDHVTRAEAAALLTRAFGYEAAPGFDFFIDDDGSMFEFAINGIATAGVTKGCNPPTNNRFCPNETLLRGQAASMLGRALGLEPHAVLPRTEIVYVMPSGDTSDLWLASLTTDQRFELTKTSMIREVQPVWSPDRTGVAYVADDSGDVTQIMVIGVDGSPGQRLGDGWSPSWSPDGERIAFVGTGTRGVTLFVGDAAGGPLGEIFSSGAGSPVVPRWSPDGHLIAFSFVDLFAFGAEYSVIVLEDDGTEVVTLTGLDPAFRPGTNAFAYSAGCNAIELTRRGGYLAIVNHDGSGEVALTAPRDDGCDLDPQWSPDGTQISFTRAVGFEQADLWVVNADGSEPRQLTTGSIDTDHQWTPDGERLLFTRRTAGSESPLGVFVVDADGSNLRLLLDGASAFDIWQ